MEMALVARFQSKTRSARPRMQKRNDKPPAMLLTPELVALSIRPEPDLGTEPTLTPHTDAEYDALAREYNKACGDGPFWVFAYGSLIWKPGFESVERKRATAFGWHRTFCLRMTRFRASPEQPGLMMALGRGGRCNGIICRLPEEDREKHVRSVFVREARFRESLRAIRWIPVQTETGRERALAFWAGPEGERVMHGLTPEETASILARACGPGGSCAEYLYNTVAHLEEFGIRDRNLWRLQELVAEELRKLHDAE
jgi:cation transport protein ChaC